MPGKITALIAPAGQGPDPGSVAQLERCLEDEHAVAGALMADHHLGYSMPIGGVVSYDGAVSPSGVGFDIGCGNLAVRTLLLEDDIRADLSGIADAIASTVPFGVGRSSGRWSDLPFFDEHRDILRELSTMAGPRAALSQKARSQLGTVGGGNHYVDLLVDSRGAVWVACHFGSRGLGHTVASGFLNVLAGREFSDGKGREPDGPQVLETDTEQGRRYLAAMRMCGEYAAVGRNIVVDDVLNILGTIGSDTVSCHHNFAWFEDGLWVVRKGATPLTSERAFIGGSMGEGAAIVHRHPATRFDTELLRSAPHGAGRAMSRTAAAGKQKRTTVYACADCGFEISARDRAECPELTPDENCCPACPGRLHRETRTERKTVGKIDWDAAQTDLESRGIELRGAGADEAPGAYKSLRDVLAAHTDVEVLEWLRPIAVVMAGPDGRKGRR